MSAPIENELQAASWLEGLIDHEKSGRLPYQRLGLDPIRSLLSRLGDPQRGLPVIHVAGSKGKGSTALFTEAILRAAGERVGTFTSPHLERWSERFRIDGDAVPGAALARAVERLRPHVEALQTDDPFRRPSFFDATTAAALLLFREAGVDHAVIEVGLGGRLDSTNVVEPRVACVTGIELEHTAQLGDTLAAIAGEKAGILKPGVPAVMGRLPAEAARVLEACAAERGVPLLRLGREFDVEVRDEGLDGSALLLRHDGDSVEVRISAPGSHQAENAALAAACVRLARPDDAADARVRTLRSGLAAARLPGRVEVVGRAPWMIVDGAHTGASARALARVLRGLSGRRLHLVLSVSTGKAPAAFLPPLLSAASEVTLTRAEPRRSLAPAEVAAAVRALAPRLPARVVPNPHLALRAAREALGPEDVLVATGSVYLAGIARRILRAPAASRPVAVGRAGAGARLGEP